MWLKILPPDYAEVESKQINSWEQFKNEQIEILTEILTKFSE